MTNSPQIAGTVGALGAIPYLIFSLPAGALVDRWDRKKVMIICDSVRAFNMLTVPLAIAFGFLTVWQLFVVALIEGTCFVWFNIARVAALHGLYPKNSYLTPLLRTRLASPQARLLPRLWVPLCIKPSVLLCHSWLTRHLMQHRLFASSSKRSSRLSAQPPTGTCGAR